MLLELIRHLDAQFGNAGHHRVGGKAFDDLIGRPDQVDREEGWAVLHQDAFETVARWRALADSRGYSLRETAVHVFSRTEFIGTPSQVAARIDDFV